MYRCNINQYYEDIVQALLAAANRSVVRIPVNSLKPYWNDHLDYLKQDSIFWYGMWLSAGRPASGTLFHIQRMCKAKYKRGISSA